MAADLKQRKVDRQFMLNQVANVDASSSNSVNRANKTIYTIEGAFWKAVGASTTDVTNFGKVLAAIKKKPILTLAGTGTGAKIDNNGKLEDFSVNALIGKAFKAQDVISTQTDAEGNVLVVTKNGQFNLKIEDVGLVRDRIQGVGSTPWQYKVAITDIDNNQKKYVDVFQPYQEVNASVSTELVDKYRADMEYENFLNDAKAQGIIYKDTNPNLNGSIEYLPGSVPQVIIRQNNGKTEQVNANSPAAKAAYKRIYNTKSSIK
jgi:hypothetical protein